MLNKSPIIKIDKNVPEISVFAGETLTVYLHPYERWDKPSGRNCEQIELRVTPDGKFEIYTDSAQARPFADWYVMQ